MFISFCIARRMKNIFYKIDKFCDHNFPIPYRLIKTIKTSITI
jgi:hypothetical protein